MKHLIILLALLSFPFVSSTVSAQCYIGAHSIGEQHVHDTTYKIMVVDTSVTGISGLTYTWQWDDGTTSGGPVAALPITDASVMHSYTVTVNGPGMGCSYSDAVGTTLVFNCTTLPAINYRNVAEYGVVQSVLTDPNTVTINFINPSYSALGDMNLAVHFDLDWGNGNIISTVQAYDTLALIGGATDPAHASHYVYPGQYKIHTQYSYSYGALTCPVVDLGPECIWVTGRAAAGAPEIGGHRSYCIGDTLRLKIVDTIAQFRNAYHRTDTTGVAHYDIVPGVGGAYPLAFGPNRQYWWGRDGITWPYADTLLEIPGLTMADTGIYYLEVFDEISLTDTILQVHISIDNAIPSVAATTGASSVCAGYSITLNNATPGGVWSSSSAEASVSPDGAVTGITSGSATIAYTVSNSCGSTTANYPITILPASTCATSVADQKNEGIMTIYPNPSQGSLSIKIPANDADIMITNIAGKLVTNFHSSGKSVIPVDLHHLPSGTYLLKVSTGNNVYRDKIIIE